MSAFVNQLRARAGTIRVGDGAGDLMTVRVQVPEVWDAVRVASPAAGAVKAVKAAAVAALLPEAQHLDDLVVKLNGFEVLDENASLVDAGARDGSTFLVTHRRRRPTR